jgi:hypothetical protein
MIVIFLLLPMNPKVVLDTDLANHRLFYNFVFILIFYVTILKILSTLLPSSLNLFNHNKSLPTFISCIVTRNIVVQNLLKNFLIEYKYF